MLKWLRRLIGYCLPKTLAGRAALTTALLLVVIVLVALTVFFMKNSVPLGTAMPPGRMVLVLALLVAIPMVVFVSVRNWMRVEQSLFPEIDSAWQSGLEGLQNARLSLSSAPVFLILGSSGERLEESIVQALRATGVNFRVDGMPAATAVSSSLRWYAHEEAIYLFCSGVGALSALAKAWEGHEGTYPAAIQHDSLLPSPGAGKAVGPGRKAGVSARGGPSDDETDTVDPADFTIPANVRAIRQPSRAGGEPAVRASDDLPGPRKSPAIAADSIPDAAAGRQAGAPGQASEVSGGKHRLPSDINVDKEALRLRYLCRLLKRARWPRCGINGVVTLLPFELIEADRRDLDLLTDVVREDLAAIQSTLWLRFPVTALVVAMEYARGFSTFVRLLGSEYRRGRLGAGFDVRLLPTGARLRALSDGICDRFEDFVYILFGREEALQNHRDNMKLYGLLCRIRGQLKPKLYQVLRAAFGVSARDNVAEQPSANGGEDRPEATSPVRDNESSPLFSGCYLAATGSAAEEQAFLRGLLHDKLIKEQSLVEWTDKAWQFHLFFRIAVWAGWIVFAILSAWSILMVVSRLMAGS